LEGLPCSRFSIFKTPPRCGIEWSYLKAGKLHRHTLTPEQADIMRLAIANNRKAKKLLRTWEAQTLHLIELKTPK
jgi:hypothetical protein